VPRGVNRFDEARLQGRLWTPTHLRTKPRIWMSARNAVFAGGSLSAIKDRATGAAFTVVGSPTPGIALNGLPTVRFDSDSECVKINIGAWGTSGWGTWAFFGARNTDSMATHAGYANQAWGAGGGGHYGIHGSTGDNQVYMDSIFVSTAPYMRLASGRLDSDANGVLYSVIGRLGSTNGLWRNASTLTPTTNATGTFPNLSFDWEIGRGDDAGTFSALQDFAEMLFLDFQLTQREIDLIHGWMHWEYGAQDKLPASNPFGNRPPLIGD
jgi:hypothetical protein